MTSDLIRSQNARTISRITEGFGPSPSHLTVVSDVKIYSQECFGIKISAVGSLLLKRRFCSFLIDVYVIFEHQ